jgi:hypothetical protein
MNLQDLCQILSDHFAPKAKQVTRFAHTGYSFEEWVNWEIFTAFVDRGYQAFPKPAYKRSFNDNTSKFLGDLRVCGHDGAEVFLEVATAHPWTQSKWREKILNDRVKLEKWVPKAEKTLKIQIVISCSSEQKDLENKWLYWYERIGFWADKGETLILDDGGTGEVVIKVWEVT